MDGGLRGPGEPEERDGEKGGADHGAWQAGFGREGGHDTALAEEQGLFAVVEAVDGDEDGGADEAADADAHEGEAADAGGEVVDDDFGRRVGGEDEGEGGEEGEEHGEVEGGVG